jgi:hypothetical protein
VPPESEDEIVTFFVALPLGLVVESDTLPLLPLFQTIYILGLGVPLVQVFDVPETTPPVMHHDMYVLNDQFPLIVYWYSTPAVTQVGPVIEICACTFCEKTNREIIKGTNALEIFLTSIRIALSFGLMSFGIYRNKYYSLVRINDRAGISVNGFSSKKSGLGER